MNRRLMLLALSAAFLSYMPLCGSRVVFTLFALELGASSFEAGLIVTGMQLPMLLLSIPMAQLTERFGARAILILGQVLGSISLLLPYLFPVLPSLYLAAALGGLWSVMSFQPSQKLVGALSARHELARNFSIFAFCAGLSMLIGPFIAGVAIDWMGHRLSSFSMLPFAIAGALTLLVWGGALPGALRGAEAPPQVRETLADPQVWRLIGIGAMLSMPFELYPFILPLYGHAAGLSASAIGIIVSASAVGALVLPLFLPWLVKRLGEERVLAISLAGIALSFAAVPLTASAPVLLLSSLLFGFAGNTNLPVTTIMAYARLPERRASQFLGLRNTANGAVRSAAPPVFGALAALVGLPAAILLSAALILAGGVWVGTSGKEARTSVRRKKS